MCAVTELLLRVELNAAMKQKCYDTESRDDECYWLCVLIKSHRM